MKTVICDLDGTLFNIDHRLHYLDKKDWDGFFAAVKDDIPNMWCVQLLHSLIRSGDEIIFVSGRNSVAREATEAQLNALGFGKYELFMRPEKSREPDYLLKEHIYESYLKDRDILFAIDDRSQVVKMWRSKGIVVLQCDEGEF